MKFHLMAKISALILTFLLATGCLGTPNLTKSPSDEKAKEGALGEISYKESTSSSTIISYNDDERLQVPANMVMVLANDDATEADIENLAKDLNGKIVGEFEFINLYQIETQSTNQNELDDLIKKASAYEFVVDSGPMLPLVGKDIEGEACKIADDIYTDSENSSTYEMIGLQRAWDLINASGIELHKVKVGVVDTGYNDETADGKKDTKIQALTKDDTRNTNDDYNTHGTSVANLIGASWENGGMRGIAGGLGENLEVNIASLTKTEKEYIPVTTGDPNDPSHYIHSTGQAYLVNTFAEIKKQIENGAEVINYSWGSATIGPHNHFDNAVTKVFLQKIQTQYPKVVFVAAAGNEAYVEKTNPSTGEKYWEEGVPLDGTNSDMGGTKADNLITVGALNSDGTNAWFTTTATTGGEITLSAQGVDVPLGFNEDGTTYTANGTSFSTPQVSAAVAVLKSINPELTAKEIKEILVTTADTKITNPKLLLEGVKEQKINSNVGGKVLRLDKAVASQLKVVMGPTFNEEKLENISKITATAQVDKEDPLHFNIQVNIPEVSAGGTDVSATYSGNGMLSGKSTQHISGSGSLNWGFTFLNAGDSTTLTFARNDSNACVNLRLKTIVPVALNAKGRWSIAGDSGAIDLTFMSTGGPVSGLWGGGNKYGSWYVTMTGSFDGGDGGAVHGTHSGGTTFAEMSSVTGSWSGTISLKEGKGSGSITSKFSGTMYNKTKTGSWSVTFPPLEMEY